LPAPIRSYQRLFQPDRRIYQVDGRRLPVPGGVPLAWVGWAFAAAVFVLILSQRSIVLALFAGALGGWAGATVKGWRAAAVFAVAGLLGMLLVGVVLGWLAWPLRLIVLPALSATLACHPASDGRPAHRYLISRVAVKLRPPRHSLGRSLEVESGVRLWAPQVWIAADHHGAVLNHGRVHGPARLTFSRRIVAIPVRGRLVVRPAEGHRLRPGQRLGSVIELSAGQVVEVRP
jgi:hypothetical protein